MSAGKRAGSGLFPNGRLVGGILSQVAQWERELIGERTKATLAEVKAAGVRVGRPPAVPPEVVRRIRRRRTAGWSLPRIADALEAEGTATAHGGEHWWPSTVRAILNR